MKLFYCEQNKAKITDGTCNARARNEKTRDGCSGCERFDSSLEVTPKKDKSLRKKLQPPKHGDRYGLRTVISNGRISRDTNGNETVKMKCQCGEVAFVPFGAIRQGLSKACRQCSAIERLKANPPTIGEKFGDRVVISTEIRRADGKTKERLINVRCKCGQESWVHGGALKGGRSKQCAGCKISAQTLSENKHRSSHIG